MTTKKIQGQSEPDGKTKKEILLYIMNHERYIASTPEIRDHLRQKFNIREPKGVNKHIDDLVKASLIIECPGYKIGLEKKYTISEIYDLANYFKSDEHCIDFIRTPYYQENTKALFDMFCKKRPDAKESVDLFLIGLKHSPAFLDFVFLNEEKIQERINNTLELVIPQTIFALKAGIEQLYITCKNEQHEGRPIIGLKNAYKKTTTNLENYKEVLEKIPLVLVTISLLVSDVHTGKIDFTESVKTDFENLWSIILKNIDHIH